MPDRVPTPEQERVLSEETERIRVVRAAPGSGKTWLIAEAMRRECESWWDQAGGIAALSFTNVAREEIHRALGGEPHHPHTVRTLDSFLFRYVVRPFLPSVRDWGRNLRLIPADQVASVRMLRDESLSLKVPGTKRQRASIFDFVFVGGEVDKPLFSVSDGWGNLKRLSEHESEDVFVRKKELWGTTGWVSHSDTAYIAASLLSSNKTWADPMRRLLARRFPFLILDESQDTGRFRSRAVLELLSQSTIRGLIVGDPDQAIFQFTGATPDIFYDFENLSDAKMVPMHESLRCPEPICRVARTLSSERRAIMPRDEAFEGKALLVPHEGSPEELATWLREIALGADDTVHVLARKNSTVNELRGRPQTDHPSYYSRPIAHLDSAVRAFRRGNNSAALTDVSSAFSHVLFGTELMPEGGIDALGTSEFAWRKQCVAFLFAAHKAAVDCCCWDWGCQMKEDLTETFTTLGWWDKAPNRTKPRKPRRTVAGRFRWPDPNDAGSEINPSDMERKVNLKTVHGAKGETHYVTIYFVPSIPRNKPHMCPSEVWFNPDSGEDEERRIAYVAATRAKRCFVLCVPRDCLARLQKKRSEFVDEFEVLSSVNDLPEQLPIVSLA